MPTHSTDAVFRALAHPTRRGVLQRLARGNAPVSDLHAPFDMAMPSFLQHLRVLEDAGLVRSNKEGRVRTYTLEPEAFEPVRSWLDEQRSAWERRLDAFDAYLLDLKAQSQAASTSPSKSTARKGATRKKKKSR